MIGKLLASAAWLLLALPRFVLLVWGLAYAAQRELARAEIVNSSTPSA